MTHTDLLKTFQWHCLNEKFIHLRQKKPSTLSTMNWLIRIKKGLTRTKVDRKVQNGHLYGQFSWRRGNTGVHISPPLKYGHLSLSLGCPSSGDLTACCHVKKSTAGQIVQWQSTTVFEAPHRYNRDYLGTSHTTTKLESCDNQTNPTHGFNIFWLTNVACVASVSNRVIARKLEHSCFFAPVPAF